jgi:tRNA (guanine37-N1)-methyltransferase
VIFHVLTLFPEIFAGYRESSIFGRALDRGLVGLDLVNIRDFARDRHRTCDDATYGGGAGMVLKPEPLAAALESIRGVAPRREEGEADAARQRPGSLSPLAGGTRVIYLTPSGRLWRQSMAEELAGEAEAVLICGRYEGVDQRIVDIFVHDEVSVGDYVLSGGEVAAMVLIDTVSRLVPGVIKEQSLAEESFRRGLLEYPQYTRPQVFRRHAVPEILLTGNHAEIERWRLEKSLEKTKRLRPELVPELGRGEMKDGRGQSDRSGADQE